MSGNPQSAIRNPQSGGSPQGELPPPPAGWLSVADAARAMGKSASNIRARCQAGSLPSRMCRGVRGAEWFVDPAAVPALRLAAGAVDTPVIATDPLAGLTTAQREKVYRQYKLVRDFEADLAAGTAMTADAFADLWCQAQRALGEKVSRSTLYRWRQKIAAGGIAALADRRGGCNTSDFSPEAQSFILGQYLSENRPSLSLCIERAEAVAASRGWSLPTRATIRRHIKRYADPKLITCGRDGRKFRDRCLPDIRRDWDKVKAMDLWVADHRQLDVMVPVRELVDERVGARKTGRKIERWSWRRPYLTMFMDMATWMPVAWDLRFEAPDANQVMSVFCQGVSLWGKPGHLYLDNGKDFRAKRFAGGRHRAVPVAAKDPQISGQYDVTGVSSCPGCRPPATGYCRLDEAAITPMLEMLGIGVTWAIPYNAKAKTIEPFFRILSERFDKTFDTYVGSKSDRRPERIKAMTGKAADFFDKGLTLASVLESLTRWIQDDYGQRTCPVDCRRHFSTQEAFLKDRSAEFVCQKPPAEDLALLLMPSKRVVVGKNGIYCRQHDRLYWSDALLDRAAASGRDTARHVVYRYRDDDDSMIYVFDANSGKYLCAAEPFAGDKVHPLAEAGSDSEVRLSQAMELKGHVAKAFRRHTRELRRQSHEILLDAQRAGARAGGRLAAEATQPLPAPVVVRITPEVSAAAAQAARDKADTADRKSARSRAREFLMGTGTDAADAAPRRRNEPSAMDLLADREQQ